MLHHLTDEDIADPVHAQLRNSFDQSITNCLGPNCSISDFSDPEDLTPDLAYSNDDGIKVTPTKVPSRNYISTEIMLLKGGTMSRGQ